MSIHSIGSDAHKNALKTHEYTGSQNGAVSDTPRPALRVAE